ncbi:NAD-dependent epimerase/dehydratase family protein [Microbacterium ulmi]|uniref:NAD(P)-dependent oxidoreductase n=1 Tax=Microbacterium ulmi TaxID=179095 RepID=A0A7Y2LZ92_9MICO|nr:NAD(P)-dependent oxidoreductase [Microbacterium ulmi]NII69754.1 GDP-4-dehydro-6-deoxy-D-mannose reductase [Microbacterium ulmi]NNH03272.1 NAD(P)-dependent oxidoreductase [Microbacterium ulmi]
MTTVTVTGVDGFVGRHLVRVLRRSGARVVGVSQNVDVDPSLRDDLDRVVTADLTRGVSADALGDVVVHLAGLASVDASFTHPQRYLTANTAMLTVLGEAVLRAGRPTRLVIAGSGVVYGSSPSGAPVTEGAAWRPHSPYAVSKAAVEHQAAYYRSRGVDAVVLRPFNNVGPGQSLGYIVPDLVAAVRRLGDGERLPTRGLDTRRDYTDVRDVAQAYTLVALADHVSHTVYNVATGRAVAGADVLAIVCDELGRDMPELHVRAQERRAEDASSLVGDATRLRQEFGWEPRIPLRESIRDFIAQTLAEKRVP